MPNSRSTRGVAFLVVILLLGAGGWLYWRAHRDTVQQYYTTTATRGEIVETVTATGTIKPLLDVLVSSQISGYVTAWYADFNAKVKKGDLLASLLPTSYEAAVESAEGNLANAKANFDLQNVTLKRDKALLAQNLLAQSDYDAQVAQVAEAAAQIKIQQASLDTAETNLSYCQIRSPIDGMVIARDIDVGNSVAATLQAPTIYEIGNDLTKMQIDASVAEADVGNVHDGETVDFTVDAYPNREFHGTVYQVRNAPQTQQNVVIYDVMINVDNSQLLLKPGMTANTSIVITKHENVLELANSALRFRMPDELLSSVTAPPQAPSADGGSEPGAKRLTSSQRNDAVREIFDEAGYSYGQTVTPQIRQKILELAKERGVDLPERFLNGILRGGGSGDIPVYRTVYRLPSNAPGAKPEAVRVRIGITDGTNTEILGGLKEDDILITGFVQMPAAMQRLSMPFH